MMSRIQPRAVTVTIAAVLCVCRAAVLSAQTVEVEDEFVQAGVRAAEVRLDLLEAPAAPPFRAGGVIPVDTLIEPVVGLPDLPDPVPVGGSVPAGGGGLLLSGSVGGGSGNSVHGSLDLSRFGDGPDFRIAFEQDRTDGGWFREPGAGYLFQDNVLETWLSFASERWEVEGSADYSSGQRGLQGESLYYAADRRSAGGNGTVRWRPSESMSLFATFDAADARQILSVGGGATDALSTSHGTVRPALGFEAILPRVTVEGGIRYSSDLYTGTPLRDRQRVAAYAEGEFVVGRGVHVAAGAETAWIPSHGVYFPASLSVETDLGRALTVEADARYTVTEPEPETLWSDVPAAYPAEDAGMEESVEAGLFAQWRIVPNRFSLAGDLRGRDLSRTLDTTPYDEGRGLFPVTLEDRQEISSGISARLTVGPWRASTEWRQEWGDRAERAPESVAGIRLGYVSDRVSTTLSGSTAAFDAWQTPVVDFRGTVAVTANVDVSLFGDDLVAIVTEDKRTAQGAAVGAKDPFTGAGPQIGALVTVRF